MSWASRIGLGVMMAALLPWTATAQAPNAPAENAEQAKSLGSLAPYLLYGQEDNSPWIGETDGSSYRLINSDDPDAITYFFVGTPPENDGRRTISIRTCVLQGDGKVGLFYGYREQPKQYYLFVLDATGLLQMFHRPPEGGLVEAFHAKLQGNTPEDGKPAGPLVVTLKLVESGNTAAAFVDDVKVGEIQGPTVGKGDVGIAGVGRIDGLFVDFALQTADE